MNNQRGGVISKLLMIPLGVALMVGFFFLGYYVGKYQSKSISGTNELPPLPEVASPKMPKQDELTFYKTLTDKGNKTVSLDLKPASKAAAEKSSQKKETAPDLSPAKSSSSLKPEKQVEIKISKSGAEVVKPAEPKSVPLPANQEPSKQPVQNDTVRYSVQIGSYPDRALAEEEVKRMKKRGYAAFLVASEVPEKGTWYRVRLGSFTKKTAAEKLINELRSKEGLSPFITVE